MEFKERNELLTKTFMRMDKMGITEPEDIIAEQAKEIEEYRANNKWMEEHNNAASFSTEDVIKSILNDLKERIYSISISDGAMDIYFDSENKCNCIKISGDGIEIPPTL